MRKLKDLSKQIFQIEDEKAFHQTAMDVFRIQSEHNLVYKEYLNNLNIDPGRIKSIVDIPFLPIEFFKNHKVILENKNEEIIFSSSGTTGMIPSQHLVADLTVYEQSFLRGFQHFFGDVRDYYVLALLPSYMEREGSSLLYLADKLIHLSGNNKSGFFLDNLSELVKIIHSPELKNKKVLLLGVTFALLDLAENFKRH